MNITASLITIGVGVVIPILVNLLTKLHASPGLKAFLAALLAAVSGVLNGLVSATPHGWHQWEAVLWQIFLGWLAATTSYVAGWKPFGIAPAVAKATAAFGLGSAATADAGYIDLYGLAYTAGLVLVFLVAAALAAVVSWWVAAVWGILMLLGLARFVQVTHRSPLRR